MLTQPQTLAELEHAIASAPPRPPAGQRLVSVDAQALARLVADSRASRDLLAAALILLDDISRLQRSAIALRCAVTLAQGGPSAQEAAE